MTPIKMLTQMDQAVCQASGPNQTGPNYHNTLALQSNLPPHPPQIPLKSKQTKAKASVKLSIVRALMRIICRTALSKSQNYAVLTSFVNPHHHNNFSSKSNNSTNKKKQPEDSKKSKSKPSDASTAVQSESATSVEEMELARARARRLAEDDRDTFLDVGPNNRPLFTKTPSLSLLTRKDACT
ncbi:hypothetical protein Patl1_35098 [Pistacia atlantica]|uniref:Uncharacterized protein n=1 Tax=Pistacia atlantica TaxID=434234 RepID=A0ACC0ZRJ8_9ROSI|nr:hypothetical protein Patl1_35098 [Pistacia atlantica]